MEIFRKTGGLNLFALAHELPLPPEDNYRREGVCLNSIAGKGNTQVENDKLLQSGFR